VAWLAMSACSSFASLGKVQLAGKELPSLAGGHLTVLREGARLAAEPGMTLQKGDTLTTGPNISATIFIEGAAAHLRPNTRVELGSIFTWFGEVFISGWLTTKTRYATASVEGTEYAVNVDRATGETHFTVVEGHVRIEPTDGSWEPIVLAAGQRLSVGSATKSRPEVQFVTARELDMIKRSLAHTTAPHMMGLAKKQALVRLRASGMAVGKVAHRPVVDPRQFDRVVAQEPAPGQVAQRVAITVGVAGVVVPDLRDLTPDAAKKRLEALGLSVGQLKGAKGRQLVVAQHPQGGELVAIGTRVALKLQRAGDAEAALANAAGAPAVPAGSPAGGAALGSDGTVPDVTGVAPGTAVEVLEGLGFEVDLKQQHFPGLRRAAVSAQRPVAKAKLQQGAKVLLHVDAPGARVPDVIGATAEQAVRELRVARLSATQTDRPVRAGADGRVIAQQPAADALVAVGSAVAITVARKLRLCEVPEVADLVAQAQDRQVLASALTQRVQAAGLSPRITIAPGTGSHFDTDQVEPAPHTSIACGQPVTIRVVRPPADKEVNSDKHKEEGP
ncbi:MAG: PASTA domain-containing protein, partial [Myxococcales bacterium]|nr:PASTA domain-containing protein [Myxococcales bacterium]